MGVPIYERPPPKYTATRILQILLDPNIEQSLIAKGRPIEAKKSSTFVVDLTCFKHPDDVKKDMYGRCIPETNNSRVDTVEAVQYNFFFCLQFIFLLTLAFNTSKCILQDHNVL